MKQVKVVDRRDGRRIGRLAGVCLVVVLFVGMLPGVVAAELQSLRGAFEREHAEAIEAAFGGDREAITQIVNAAAEALAADAEDPEARVWQGIAQVFGAEQRALRANPRWLALYREGLANMERAVDEAPEDVVVRAARGRFLREVAARVPSIMAEQPARDAAADLVFVAERLGHRLHELPIEEQVAVLLGIAEVSARHLREVDQAVRYAERVIQTLPNTSHAALAQELLAEAAGELTENVRIRGLAILWSEIKYNFAHFDNVPELDWDQVFAEYLPKVREAESLHAYYRVLEHCVAQLRDGHTRVQLPYSRFGWSKPGVTVLPVEGRAVVTAVAEDIGLVIGDAITHVDGVAVDDRLAQLYPYIADFTPQGRDRLAYAKLLAGPVDEPVTLRAVSLEGDERDVTLQRQWSEPQGADPEAIAAELVPEEYAYVRLSTFGSDEGVARFHERFSRILEADGLIIDLRGNGGGMGVLVNQIIRRLIDEEIPGLHYSTPVHRAAAAMSHRPLPPAESHETIQPADPPHYTGPIVVLVDADSASASENFTATLHGAGRATVIGQPSSGTTGGLLIRRLPAGITLGICTQDTWYADGRRFIGQGIQPDIEVHPSQQDIAEGNDPVLAQAVAVLRQAAP